VNYRNSFLAHQYRGGKVGARDAEKKKEEKKDYLDPCKLAPPSPFHIPIQKQKRGKRGDSESIETFCSYSGQSITTWIALPKKQRVFNRVRSVKGEKKKKKKKIYNLQPAGLVKGLRADNSNVAWLVAARGGGKKASFFYFHYLIDRAAVGDGGERGGGK